MDAEHAPLAPSSAPVWGHCSGSVSANMQVVKREHSRTRDGTASHWVGSECLTLWKEIDVCSAGPSCSDWIGKTAPNGVIIDQEMAEGAHMYVDNALNICHEHKAFDLMLIEHRVYMPDIHKHNWGTLDLAIPLLNYLNGQVVGGMIYLIDYKYGHRANTAFENFQLLDYVFGLTVELNIDVQAMQNTEVIFQIVQPFSYHADNSIDECRVTLSEVLKFKSQLRHMANEAFTNPKFTSGPHCRDCESIMRCATNRKSSYSLIDYANEPFVIDNMNSADLANERRILTSGLIVTKARLEAIEEELTYRIKKGDTQSGLTVQSAFGRLDWDVPAETAISLARQFGVDATKADVLTPTQTIDAASKDMKPYIIKVLKSVTSRPPRGVKLIKVENCMTSLAFSKKE